jgi:mycothiol maleylpyruvate isomerase-like protein
VDQFFRSWGCLLAAVACLPDQAFDEPSGCSGWRVRDLVCHLVIDAQDVLITLATPANADPTRDAVTYWEVAGEPPTGDDPLDALTVRLASAYGDPGLLKFHLDDVGSAAGRAARMCDPGLSDEDVLLIGTGRRSAINAETAVLGELAATLPFVLC